jgi:hypothetical protein
MVATGKIGNNSQGTPTWGIKPHLEGVSEPHLVSSREKKSYIISLTAYSSLSCPRLGLIKMGFNRLLWGCENESA